MTILCDCDSGIPITGDGQFLVEFPLAAFVFASKCSHHAHFCKVIESVQPLVEVFGNVIVITEPSYFLVVLGDDCIVAIVNERSSGRSLPFSQVLDYSITVAIYVLFNSAFGYIWLYP